jgi:outer membrane lipoprotein SlyB
MMYRYTCSNSECPYAGRKGYRIQLERANVAECPYCSQRTLRREGATPAAGARPTAGAAGGALLGWAVGGPAGAVIGGLVGLLLGGMAEQSDNDAGPKR